MTGLGAKQTSSTSVASVNDGSPADDLLRRKGMEFAQRTVEQLFQTSRSVDRTDEFPRFRLSEVQRGKVLGRGGFGTVYEVRSLDVSADPSGKGGHPNGSPQPSRAAASSSSVGQSVRYLFADANQPRGDGHEDDQVQEGQMESRRFIAEHCIRRGGDARYALKILSADTVADPGTFIQGVMDMAVETRFLSDMEHPNIIKMRATAQGTPYHAEYFIVMDRLYDTLEKRLQTWAKTAKRSQGALGRLTGGGPKKQAALYEERIVAAFDLAAALQYLHGRGIVYRDLKPENIGFDIRGDIKIFDFGLAKEFSVLEKDANGLYKMTGMTGSPRYMAPEVGLEQPYNETVDSYSFAILLWEMMALRTPFELYTMKNLKAKVWLGARKRPPIDDKWPVPVKLLLKRSWDGDISVRNNMTQITAILRKECTRCRGGDDSGLEHTRRRSTFVYRPKHKHGSGSLVAAQ